MNQYYDVRVWKEGNGHFGVGWRQEGTPYQYRPDDGQGKYWWAIAVIQHNGFNSDGTKKWELISEESEVRWFEYTYSPPEPPEPPKPED